MKSRDTYQPDPRCIQEPSVGLCEARTGSNWLEKRSNRSISPRAGAPFDVPTYATENTTDTLLESATGCCHEALPALAKQTDHGISLREARRGPREVMPGSSELEAAERNRQVVSERFRVIDHALKIHHDGGFIADNPGIVTGR